MTCEELLENIDAYALGALSAEEASAVERHIATCQDCARELRLATAVVERLPLAVPVQRAPSALRDRIFAAVAAEASSGAGPSEGSAAGAGSRGDSVPHLRVLSPTAVPETEAAEVSPRGADAAWQDHPRGRWTQAFAFRMLATAAALAAIVGLAGWSFSLQRQLNDVKGGQARAVGAPSGELTASQTALVLLSARNTVTGQLDPPSAGAAPTGGVIWNPALKRCVILAQQLGPLPSGSEYHVWFRAGDEKWDGGPLVPDATGTAEIVIDMTKWDLGKGYHVAIVVQPHVDDGTRRVVLGGDLSNTLQ